MMQVKHHSILAPPPFPSHYTYMPCFSGHSIGSTHKRSPQVHSRGRQCSTHLTRPVSRSSTTSANLPHPGITCIGPACDAGLTTDAWKGACVIPDSEHWATTVGMSFLLLHVLLHTYTHIIIISNGIRRDGLSLIPWHNGKALSWDVTVICPLAESYISAAARDAGAVAKLAASRKEIKYVDLDKACTTFLFGGPHKQFLKWSRARLSKSIKHKVMKKVLREMQTLRACWL